MHRIGPCRIEAIVSKGKTGLVYKGFHEGLDRPALIKTLGAVDPDERERMHLDAQAQIRLEHPGIARLYDFIEDQGQVFIASEYIEGTSLDVLHHGIRFTWNEALALFQQVLAALEHAHRNGVIHRDVQPANLRVFEGRVKLTDFAIGSAGDPSYLSPEQSRSAEIDHRTDIYSAAAVLYEMLAGRPPFQGETDLDLIQSHLSQIPADLKTLVPDLPAGVSAAVTIALHKEPRQRFQTAADFLRALQEASAGFLPAAPQPAPIPSPPAPTLEALEAPAVQESSSVPGRSWQRQRKLVAASWIVLGLDLLGSYGLWKVWKRPSGPSQPLQPSRAARPHSSVTPAKAPLPVPLPSTPEPAEMAAEEVRGSPDPEDPVSSKTEHVEPPPFRQEGAAPLPVIAEPTPDPEEIRRRDVDRVRDEVRQGIQRTEADLQEQKLDVVQEQLDRLMSQAQRYPVDLSEEIAKIRDLRNALVAAQEGERRLQQIRKLMEQGKYPEADNLARDLADETGVPEVIAAQARELSTQAKAELKKIWGDTQLGPTKNKVRKPPDHRERMQP